MSDNRLKYIEIMSQSEVIRFINKQYHMDISEFSRVSKLSDIRKDSSYFWSSILVIDDGSSKYLLKEILNPKVNIDKQGYAAKFDVLKHLNENDVPVLLPARAANGNYYTQLYAPEGSVSKQNPGGSHFVELSKFYDEDDKWSGAEKTISQIGSAVGKITSKLSTLDASVRDAVLSRPKIWQDFTNPETGEDFSDELERYQSFKSEIPNKIPGELGEIIVKILEPTQREYLRFKSSGNVNSETGISHGDIQHFNMLVNKKTDDLHYIIDWDTMSKNFKTHDFAYTIDRAQLPNSEKDSDFDKVYNTVHLKRADIFASHFYKQYNLSHAQEKVAFTALIDYTLMNVCGILRDTFKKDSFVHPDYAFFLKLLNVNRMRNLEKELFDIP